MFCVALCFGLPYVLCCPMFCVALRFVLPYGVVSHCVLCYFLLFLLYIDVVASIVMLCIVLNINKETRILKTNLLLTLSNKETGGGEIVEVRGRKMEIRICKLILVKHKF